MIEGNNVILEDIHPDNLEQMRLWRNNYKLRRYFREYRDISLDMQHNWYHRTGNNTDTNDIHFQIVTNNQHKTLIGYSALIRIDWRTRVAEFSIYLGPDQRNRGYGKESLELMLDYGFKELNLHRVWGEVYDNNMVSLQIYKKAGFKEEGIRKDAYFCEGKYGNGIMIAILEEEWFELHGGR